VSVVVVGAFLAASTGIVGATVVTMGLLSLPTMLRAGYSPQLATGVIAASGTLGQIIPPSIVIVLLGTLAGDLYSTAQENRAQLAGCSDALTYLGEPAVVSVGTLFQAALLPGILLALLYALYAFGYALVNPAKAPAVQHAAGGDGEATSPGEKFTWFLGVPVALIAGFMALSSLGVVGSQDLSVDSFTDRGATASLRTNVGEECRASMIDLHGQSAWDAAVAEQEAIDAAGGTEESVRLAPEQIEQLRQQKVADAAPIGTGVATIMLMLGLTLALARGVAPSANPAPLLIGGLGIVSGLLVDTLLIRPSASPGLTVVLLAIPLALALYGTSHAATRLARNELIRVVFPPLVLIVAVLGSILGGITNPTPAAALGAGGAIMLAAYRKLRDDDRSPKIILMATLAVGVAILVGINFDLRIGEDAGVETWLAFLVAYAAYLFAIFGLLFACWVLYTGGVLSPVVRETAKVTSMVFTILIGSQILNLTVISFGGEEYIQQFLNSFDNEVKVFLVVMLVLFILGFVLDFLEIIYIVVPIVGPVIYGGGFDPKWVTIMIAVNLQTSFLTPPFGFALFYLRGVAPPAVTTGHIYAGVMPFVAIQVVGLAILWFFPEIVTIVPALLRG
jgi:TRAP-type mannitol/chloroaromatic compound transport system permease large subunit